MNLDLLYAILRDTTVQLRKGEKIEQDGIATHIYLMAHKDDIAAGFEPVDLEFIVVGVDRAKAERRRDEIVSILDSYPDQERLASGASYIEIGVIIGDQGAAFQLFALGQILGFWDVITPATIGLTGQEAKDFAGLGFIMISGYKKVNAHAA